jgi:hypothetical protein
MSGPERNISRFHHLFYRYYEGLELILARENFNESDADEMDEIKAGRVRMVDTKRLMLTSLSVGFYVS